MITYIALLRGINVGGHTVKMDHLRSLFEEMGYSSVRSYIQTGNVFFETDKTDTIAVRSAIEKQLHGKLGFPVAVCLRTVEELASVLKHDPFKRFEVTSDIRLAVTFLAEPVKELIPTPFFTNDRAYELIKMTSTELFVIWHLQNGRPGNSYNQLAKLLKVESTTRFWHTTAKILAAAKKE